MKAPWLETSGPVFTMLREWKYPRRAKAEEAGEPTDKVNHTSYLLVAIYMFLSLLPKPREPQISNPGAKPFLYQVNILPVKHSYHISITYRYPTG